MIIFWLIIVLFVPQVIILLDYIFKSMYILYWEFIYKDRLRLLLQHIGHSSVSVRRITIDGFYVLSFQSYVISDRPYEFIGDGKGIIIVIGSRLKTINPLFTEILSAPISVKIDVKDKTLKAKYANLLNNFHLEIDEKPIFGPLVFKKPNLINYGILTPKQKFKLPNDDEDKEIRKLSMITFNDRKRTTEPDLYSLVYFPEYIKECVDKKLKTKEEMSKLITELIYNKIYGYTEEEIGNVD